MQPITEDVRVRRAPLARDRVHAFDVLGAQVVQRLVDQTDALVLAHARSQERVELFVGGVDHRRGVRQQLISSAVLMRRASRNTCWPSTSVIPSLREGREDRHLDDVDADRLVLETEL